MAFNSGSWVVRMSLIALNKAYPSVALDNQMIVNSKVLVCKSPSGLPLCSGNPESHYEQSPNASAPAVVCFAVNQR